MTRRNEESKTPSSVTQAAGVYSKDPEDAWAQALEEGVALGIERARAEKLENPLPPGD